MTRYKYFRCQLSTIKGSLGEELRGRISDFTSLQFKMVGAVDYETPDTLRKVIAADGPFDAILWNVGLWARLFAPE